MARELNKPNALAVTRAKKRGYLSDGGGLYLQISPTGGKSCVFRFREGARLKEMGLGSTHILTLAEAREAALLCRKQRLTGLDPSPHDPKSALPPGLNPPRPLPSSNARKPTSKATRQAGRMPNTPRSGVQP